eukprot:Amastigsp_a339675_213.p2 type:complete len:132 gc:universal Amastigsp_a339675_213:169-564(+)
MRVRGGSLRRATRSSLMDAIESLSLASSVQIESASSDGLHDITIPVMCACAENASPINAKIVSSQYRDASPLRRRSRRRPPSRFAGCSHIGRTDDRNNCRSTAVVASFGRITNEYTDQKSRKLSKSPIASI